MALIRNGYLRHEYPVSENIKKNRDYFEAVISLYFPHLPDIANAIRKDCVWR